MGLGNFRKHMFVHGNAITTVGGTNFSAIFHFSEVFSIFTCSNPLYRNGLVFLDIQYWLQDIVYRGAIRLSVIIIPSAPDAAVHGTHIRWYLRNVLRKIDHLIFSRHLFDREQSHI